jgi:transposase-like protein
MCPKCGNSDVNRVKYQPGYRCQACKYTFPVAALKKVKDNRNSLTIPKILRANARFDIEKHYA